MNIGPEPYMRAGELYKLHGMSKNKMQQYLAVMAGYGTKGPELVGCDPHGWPGTNKRRYADGDVFLCLKVLFRPDDEWCAKDVYAYLVLTPDGKTVTVHHDGNKTKFRRII